MRTDRPLVQVWLVDPGAVGTRPASAVPAGLSTAELARARALPAEQARRFVLARALLRAALATTMGCAAGDVALTARCPDCGGDHGAVTVTAPGAPGQVPHVSLTRAGPLVSVALSHDGPVGIDVESVAAVSAAPLADVVLSPAELAAHRAAHPPTRDVALARSWVRTEAALKAAGHGLRIDPALVETAADVVRVPGPDGTGSLPVLLADLDLVPGMAGAVALVYAHDDDADAGPRTVGVGVGVGGLTVRQHDGERLLAALRPS